MARPPARNVRHHATPCTQQAPMSTAKAEMRRQGLPAPPPRPPARSYEFNRFEASRTWVPFGSMCTVMGFPLIAAPA